MIQRVQTLHLLIVVILLTIMFFTPLATILTSNGELELSPFLIGNDVQESISQVAGVLYLSILMVLVLLVSIVTIFCFKNRTLQARLCAINIVFLLGLQVFIGYSIFRVEGFVEQMNLQIPNYSGDVLYSIVDVFPIIGTIFSYLAFRGIVRDEMLIKSLNRLR